GGDLLVFTCPRGGETVGTVRSPRTGKCLLRLTAPEGAEAKVAFSAGGSWLATPCADTSLLLRDVQALSRQKRKPMPLRPGESDVLWADLGAADPARAVDALDRFMEVPDAAVELLKRRVRPVSLAKLPHWLAEL